MRTVAICAAFLFLSSSCASMPEGLERWPSSQGRTFFPPGFLVGEEVRYPTTPFGAFNSTSDGFGLGEKGTMGGACVTGEMAMKRIDPRIDFFLKKEKEAWWSRRGAYVYGMRIVIGEYLLTKERVNRDWWEKISRKDPRKFAEHCGSYFVAGRELGVGISKRVSFSELPEDGAMVERFASLAALLDRVNALGLGRKESGFNISYDDTRDAYIARYNATKGFMTFETFLDHMWTNASPEVKRSVWESTNTDVGKVFRRTKLPE